MAGCGSRNYENISREKIEIMINELVSGGYVITGKNPWHIDARQHGIQLRGEWNEAALTVTITVTDTGWYVPCDVVWSAIDSLMSQIRDQGRELETA